VEDLLSWDVPFDHLEAPQGLASRVEAVEKEGVRAWRVLFFQRPSDGAKEGPAVLGARVLPEPPGLPPLTLEGSTLAFAGWRLALLGLPHGLLLPAYRPLLDGAPYPALGLTFPLGGARCYGLGERARGLERRGGRYWNLTADRFPRPGQDPLYQAHPLILCLRGARALGLLLDESAPSLFDLGFSHPGEGRVLALAPRLDLYLLEGEVLEVVRGLTLLTGRPFMPPLWALGYHQSRYSYMDEEALKEVFRRFQEEDLPLESLWLDIHYMEGYKVFTVSPHRFPHLRAVAEAMGAKGVRLVPIVDPGVKAEPGYPVYEEAKARGLLVQNERDEVLLGGVWPRPAAWPDFTREEARAFWAEKVRAFVEGFGFAGVWNDMNEPAVLELEGKEPPLKALPPGARHGGWLHLEVRNLYALGMAEATFRVLSALGRRPFILTRSGFPGIQRYAFAWTGDNASRFEDLALSIPMVLSLGLSGLPFAGADVGGFNEDATPELLTRWMWLGALYPFFRNHTALGTRRQEPYAFGEPWTGWMREALRFRYRLLPYLYALARQAHEDGLPLWRPLFAYFPQELEAYREDQFLLGEALMAAPVVRQGEAVREVWIPPGTWQDFFTGEVFAGPGLVQVSAPFSRLPLFQKAGTALPLAEPRYPTATARFPHLTFRLALGPEIRGRVYEDQGDGQEEGVWREVRGAFDGKRLHLFLEEPREGVMAEVLGMPRPLRVRGGVWREGRLLLDLGKGEAWARWA
jgi:alpha-glucosidase